MNVRRQSARIDLMAERFPCESGCNAPTLFLAASGDGLGPWQCATSSAGSINQPRLARLTAP